MSLSGNINKITGDVRRAIQSMSRQDITGVDGTLIGTKKIFGYVCEIHEEGELAGTIDVQEYGYDPDDDGNACGHHEGVNLSAIQDNGEGVLIVPMLFSEVVIVQNPADGHEYVLMYSHAKRIQYKAHEKVEIGVTELEDFSETDDGLEKDFDELEPTKNKTLTTYTPESITDEIVSSDDEEGLKQEKTSKHKVIKVGDTTVTIDGENVTIETSGKVEYKVGNTVITETDGEVSIKTDDVKVECSNCQIKGDSVKVEASDVNVKASNATITGGTLKVKGQSATDLQGPFNAIKVCPFSGAPHCGSTVSGT